MNTALEVLNKFQPYIIIGMSVIILILMILVISAFRAINKLESRYTRLTRGMDNKNLVQIVENYLDKIDENKEKINDINDMIKEVTGGIKNCLQKISIMRYKAFEDVGSDLSFSVALLDAYNTGFILTGIYGRNESIAYAKPIDRGISRYDLSEEEKNVLEDAMRKEA